MAPPRLAWEVMARDRYDSSFRSSIFDPAERQATAAPLPGKRRDQTTSELFGDYVEEDARPASAAACPPGGYPSSTPHMKCGQSPNVGGMPMVSNSSRKAATWSQDHHEPRAEAGQHPRNQRVPGEEEVADPYMRRQVELQSDLFGRGTPSANPARLHDPTCRLTPNDFTWQSHPEDVTQAHLRPEIGRHERAYHEKCSEVFGHRTPHTRESNVKVEQQAKEDAQLDASRRRAYGNYSDLFGRATPMDAANAPADDWRPRNLTAEEDRLVVHRDWMDSKTELLAVASVGRLEDPASRRHDELHRARVFGDASEHPFFPPQAPDLRHDNSQRLKATTGATPKQIHQAHLQSTLSPEGFVEEAYGATNWEVVELQLTGLSRDANDDYLRKVCHGLDLHIVKASADMDPVRNLCNGRGKISVRYNPKRDSLDGLVLRLQASQLRVEV